MHFGSGMTSSNIRVVAVVLLYTVLARDLSAQTHVVSLAELRQAVELRSHQREQNMKTVNGFMAGPHGEEVRQSARLTSQQVTAAVASLNDQELEALSRKVTQAEQHFAAHDFVGGSRESVAIIAALAVAFAAIIIGFLYSFTHHMGLASR